MSHPLPCTTLFPYTTLFRSVFFFTTTSKGCFFLQPPHWGAFFTTTSLGCFFTTTSQGCFFHNHLTGVLFSQPDRKSTRLNSSHPSISYAVFCLKKKIQHYLL